MIKIELNTLKDNEVKIEILKMIREIIDYHEWTQIVAAQMLGVDQPKISQIKNGKVSGFSLERLLLFLLKLNCKIDIVINKSSKTNLA